MTNTLANGYNIVPPSATTTQEPPDAPISPVNPTSVLRLFYFGIKGLAVSFFLLCLIKHYPAVEPWAYAGFGLSLVTAALGLVWGAFQHVLRTIVRIVRHGS